MEIYIGNIPPNIKVQELGLLYHSYGPILYIDIKNRCQPPFAFVLFDNPGSAYNAAVSTNGWQYKGYQFQVKLLTLEDNSSNIRNKPLVEKEEKAPAEKKEMRKKKKMPPMPESGKPGALGDPLRKGLSGAGTKWYLRYLERGINPKEARIKAETHKFIALGHNEQVARKKAEEQCALLFNNFHSNALLYRT